MVRIGRRMLGSLRDVIAIDGDEFLFQGNLGVLFGVSRALVGCFYVA